MSHIPHVVLLRMAGEACSLTAHHFPLEFSVDNLVVAVFMDSQRPWPLSFQQFLPHLLFILLKQLIDF